jgi:hypothetical protein
MTNAQAIQLIRALGPASSEKEIDAVARAVARGNPPNRPELLESIAVSRQHAAVEARLLELLER